jgi:transposase
MEVLHTHCAGLDIHKDTVVACARRMSDGKVEREVRTFATTTSDLLALSAWLSELAVTHVAMEATGVYWKPVWNVLDDGEFALTLANAKHVKNVPGRKTDVNDATWLADLMAHGLIRASFVPDRATMETRTLLRTRKQMTRERTRHVQRLQKTLEEANIKLDSVITDITGKSGRAMIEAMIGGESDPAVLARLAHKRIKASPQALTEALRGHVSRHHRFLLRLHLDQIDVLDRTLAEIDEEIAAGLEPFRPFIPLLTSIPGIAELSARVVLAEIGTDMTRFPTAANLVSWAGLCPKHDESAGKRRSNRMRKGAPWLKTTLIQCAWAASTAKDSYLRALYHRLKARRGGKKAVGAVAASMLTAIWHMLRDGTFYQDLGADHFKRRSKGPRQTKRLVAQLESLGYKVELSPLVA